MKTISTLKTERLKLRPFTLKDVKEVQRLAGDKRIADTTLFIPHPYPDGLAEEWISSHKELCENDKEIVWAITLLDEETLIGAIGLMPKFNHKKAEFGYWIGVPYWKKGYATEALKEILRFGFVDLNLNKIYAHHFQNNESSGFVMLKNGLKSEGYLRQDIIKNGKLIDVQLYGILRDEYFAKEKKLTVDKIDHVEVFVNDRYDAAKWYEKVLGLSIVKNFEDWADHPNGPLMISSDDGRTKLALFDGEPKGSQKNIGFLLTAFSFNGLDFIKFTKMLDSELKLYDHENKRVTSESVVDHDKAFSIYFNDPCGNRLEVTSYDYDYLKKALSSLI